MHEVMNTEVSFFETIHSKNNSIFSIKQIFDLIKEEKFKKEIDLLRTENDKIKKEEIKKKLPAITVSGLFNGSRIKQNLKVHSGLIQVDIDKVDNVEEVKDILMKDIYSLAVFYSPGGKGLKVIVKIPPDNYLHEKHFLELEQYYLFLHKIVIDKCCKDISRLMFLSSDNNIFLNENSKVYSLNTLENNEILFASAIQKINLKNHFQEGQRNNYVFKLACECKRMGLNENICLIYSKEYFSESGFPLNEIDTIIKSGYSSNNTFFKKNTEHLKENNQSLLQIRTGRQCLEDADSKLIPRMLFSEFWHEGELCILFADTNVGKSILAVQIANSISKGEKINGFKLESEKQLVFYLDFELGDKQFQNRYSSEYKFNYSFDDNFYRLIINSKYTNYEDFEKELFLVLENELQKTGCKVIIVDNITYLKTQSTETAKDALPLMRRLKELTNKFGLSMLIVAHTPKIDLSKPITSNYLAGSKHLSNFADSIFCIGISFQDNEKRYLKQIKARATEKKYDAENVIICRMDKPFNFLGFQFLGYGDERNLLKQLSDSDKAELENKIIEFKTKDPNISIREIARQLDINPMKVSRVIGKNT